MSNTTSFDLDINEFQQLAVKQIDSRLTELSSEQQQWIHDQVIIFTNTLVTLYERKGEENHTLLEFVFKLIRVLNAEVNYGASYEALSSVTAMRLSGQLNKLIISIRGYYGRLAQTNLP